MTVLEFPRVFTNTLKSIVLLIMLHGSLVVAADKATKIKSQQQQRRLKVNPMTDFENAWAATLETDIYRAGTFENFTAVYSAQNNWDIGISLLNVQILGGHNSFQGEPFINLTKTLDLNNNISLTIGALNGMTLSNNQPQVWLNFSFMDMRSDLTPWLKIHGGSYFANRAITTVSNQAGFLTGLEIEVVPNELSFQLDYTSGHHSLSGANVNMIFNIRPKFQVYLGVYVPEQDSGNEFAGVIGFNLSTHNL